jgi:hypothetical protein
VDPLAEKYPSMSPYSYCANNPVKYVDPDGRFILPATFITQYPAFAKYIENNISEVLNSESIMSSLINYGGFERSTIEDDLKWGSGPTIDIRKLGSENLTAFGHYDGKQANGEFQIALDSDMLNKFEKAFANGNVSNEAKEAALMGIVSTLLHEYIHYGTGGSVYETEEMGQKFEIETYGTNLQPDDINQLIQVRTLKTSGKLVSPVNHNQIFEMQPENIDKTVVPTLPDNN